VALIEAEPEGGCSVASTGDAPPALVEEMLERIRAVRTTPRTIEADLRYGDGEIVLDTSKPLGFEDGIVHHLVDDQHLWIAVNSAGVLVLDDRDHDALTRLLDGVPPEGLLDASCASDAEQVRASLGDLLGRMAEAGFIESTSRFVNQRMPTPARFARFHLTKSCQLSCVHCYADSSPSVDRSGEQPTEWWRQTIDELAEIGTERILFTGGEALLHRGCLDLMAHAKSAGILVALFSNGILVPKVIDRLRDSCDEVQISLDGPDPESNDAIRGRGVYGHATRALEVLLETDLRVRVGITNMASNWEAWRTSFLDFAERFADSDLEYRLSFGLTEYGRADGLGQQLQPEDTQPEVERLLRGKRGSRDGRRITQRASGCGYFEQMVFGPDGSLYPCHLLDMPVGHADDQPLTRWAAELTELARLFSVDHTEGCSECDIRYLCGGTCRVINGKRTGSRLVTTCTDGDKARRFRNLARTYAQPQGDACHDDDRRRGAEPR